MKKFITPDERLQAFALYTMANQHYVKVRDYERAIARIFGDSEEYNDQVSDAIYANDPGSPYDFEDVLKNAGIAVKKPKRKKR